MHKLIYFALFCVLLQNVSAKLVYFPPGAPMYNVFNIYGSDDVIRDNSRRYFYTTGNRFVAENADEIVSIWHERYIRLKAQCLVNDTPFWIGQPTDWHTTTYNINHMPFYNSRMYWRGHSLMRHKASVATSCWKRKASPYTPMTIVQIYHFPGKPFRIPCYICEKRLERDGRPKVFYVIQNRNIFNVNFTYADFASTSLDGNTDNKIITLQKYAFHEMSKVVIPSYFDPNSVGIEWQFDQISGDNVLTQGGDGLYLNPTLLTTVSNYGTFFCLNEKAEPYDTPEVVINVDVLTKSNNLMAVNTKDFKLSSPPPPNTLELWNLKCEVVWQPWSCPTVCTDRETSDNKKGYRIGFASVSKIDKTLAVNVQHNLQTYWNEWLVVEGYLGTHPYREDGIPLYSSLWLNFPNVMKDVQSLFKDTFKDLYYFEESGFPWSCKEKEKCEKDRKEIFETSLVDFDESQETGPDTPTNIDDGPAEGVCPIDILKHETIFVKELNQKEILKAEAAYKFICSNNDHVKISDITWSAGLVAVDNCRKNDTVFFRDGVLHVHRAGSAADTSVVYACYHYIAKGNKRKVGQVSVAYYVTYDWRPFIINIVVLSIVIFLTCPLCAWCARGVRDVTRASFELARAGAVAAAHGGLAGMVVDQMEERRRIEEEEKANAQEHLLQLKMDRAYYAKQRRY